MILDTAARRGQQPLGPIVLAASLALLLLGPSTSAAQSTADSLDSACPLPEGRTAAAIVRRVEKRLDGNWNLATRTLRQTIARQQRLGQDSGPAEEYLSTLTCLQSEVESGRHNAFLEANGGSARLAAASVSLVSQSQPTQPIVARLPDAGAQAPATSAPTELSSLSSVAASAAVQQASPPQSEPAPIPQSQQTPEPEAFASAASAAPQSTATRQVPQNRDGLILPGTPESYALQGSGQTVGRSIVPAVRPLDGSTPFLLSGSTQTSLYRQAPLAVPPRAPKERGSSFQELTARSAASAPVSQPVSQPISQPVQPAQQQVAANPPAASAAVVQSSQGDPRYVNKACLYFTRPELEVIRGRVHTNRYQSGARVCHRGAMYLCDGGLWSSQGSCSAHPDWQSVESAALEAKPRR